MKLRGRSSCATSTACAFAAAPARWESPNRPTGPKGPAGTGSAARRSGTNYGPLATWASDSPGATSRRCWLFMLWHREIFLPFWFIVTITALLPAVASIRAAPGTQDAVQARCRNLRCVRLRPPRQQRPLPRMRDAHCPRCGCMMPRRLNLAALLSVLLFLATAGLWVRGQFRADVIAIGRESSIRGVSGQLDVVEL